MEQKQLDELDESYFGEEFIDEDSLKNTMVQKSDEEVKIEMVESDSKLKKRASTRKKAAKSIESLDFNSIKPIKPEENKTVSVQPSLTVKTSGVKEEIKAETKPVSEAKLTTMKEEPRPKVEIISEGTNPWQGNNGKSAEKPSVAVNLDSSPNTFSSSSRNSLFTQASTWKALTGIMIILLIFSIFTQGFNFTGEGITGAAVGTVKEISSEKAEQRVLDYVNNQLLRPPFVARAVETGSYQNLYKIVLEISDQKIDSYITKDGRLFFPEGVDISAYIYSEPVEKNEANLEELEKQSAAETDKAAVKNPEQVDTKEETEELVNPDSEAESPSSAGAAEEVPMITLKAKRWLFSPHQITVRENDLVTLIIEPENLDFTFSIPEFGVEQPVSGTTRVTFRARRSGSFGFSCSSCEEWRGMTGTLIVN